MRIRTKVFLSTAAILIVLAVLSVVFWPSIKKSRELKQAQNQRVSDLLKKNPDLLGSIQKTIAENEEKAKKSPKDFEVLKNLGVAYQNLLEYSKAEQAYKKALEISNDSELIWNNLAVLYQRQEKYEQSRDAFLKLIELNPKAYSAYISLAEMYSNGQAGSIDVAKFLLQQGILKTNSQTLKNTLDRLNKAGKL